MDNNTNNWKTFTLGNPQEEQPKRVQKRRRSPWLTLALLALGAALIVTGVLLWDQSAFDGLRRSVMYLTAKKDENGCARLYHYAVDVSSTYAALDGSLVNLSRNQLLLINESGYTVENRAIRFTDPVLVQGSKRAVAYDVGGKNLYVLGKKGVLWELSGEDAILCATVNEQNYVTVVSGKSGYKASVSVYDGDGGVIFQYNSADRFVVCAALSRDSRYLMAVTLGRQDDGYASCAVLYRVNQEKPVADVPICDGMVYDVGWVDGRFCAVGEEGLYFVDTSGAVTATYDYGGWLLRRCTLSENGFAAVLLSRYATGSQYRLLTVSSAGDELGVVDIDREITGLSTAGRYTGLLCADSLEIYDKTLTAVGHLDDVSDVRAVLMRSDGSAVLAGTTSASLYLP
ncbi:MAG: hypothetical protein IJQ46_03815 [Oscillospiraceae bacterium]|nr:hypothetical protein [Oscillospiraceae bacterium]